VSTRPTLLVVDDEPDALDYLTVFLEAEGFDVVGASSGPEALQLIETRRPALIICDMMMPGMTGLDLCSQLRGSPETQGIPIIVWSAHFMGHSNIGLYDHAFMKATDLDELLATIRSLLEPK